MSGGILSWGDIVRGDIVRGILSGGYCPGGYCPRTNEIHSIDVVNGLLQAGLQGRAEVRDSSCGPPRERCTGVKNSSPAELLESLWRNSVIPPCAL